MPVFAPAIPLHQFTTFGDFLKYLRRRAGLTQRDLSIAVGYSDTQISRLELNQRLPDLATIAARFVPALSLEHESDMTIRLLELGAGVRREDAPAPGLSPFKGLQYFDEADAHLFFGREALIAKLVGRIIDGKTEAQATKTKIPPRQFLAIIGASGSGKSSIVRAGLIPALRWNRASVDWPIHVLTPTAQPLEALASSLTREAQSPAVTARLIDDLARDPRSLYLLARQSSNNGTSKSDGHISWLVIVDQMEELFTLCREDAERQAFVNNLLAACEVGGPVFVIVTLRADFYSHCAPYDNLREAIAQHQEYIGPMSATELRQAIESPAKRGGWEFESGLVDLILKDVGADDLRQPEPGALPLLSHALLEVWRRRQGHQLTLSGYLSSGGVRGAIAETAEAVFHDQLDPEQRAIARRIFLRLTELGDDSSVADTRRRAPFTELITSPDELPAVRAVLQQLADARLIVTEAEAAEVAHEALIREWPTLRGWLEENRDALRLHHHLAEAAHAWAEAGRQPGDLYREARLAQALEWQATHTTELNLLEREFLSTSQQHAEYEATEREAQQQRELDAARKLAEAERARAEEQTRANQQLRRRAFYLTGAFIVAFLMAGIALVMGGQARQSAQQANANAANAQANLSQSERLRLALEANALLDTSEGDPALAALLSLQALKTDYLARADEVLLKALPRLSAIRVDKWSPYVNSVVFSPDGRFIFTAHTDGTASLVDAATGKLVRQFGDKSNRNSFATQLFRAAFSPDGQYVLCTQGDGIVFVWDVTSGEVVRQFRGQASNPLSFIIAQAFFSPDSRLVLTGGDDFTARLWDMATGELVREFKGHTDALFNIAYSPDGHTILTASRDRTVRLWDAATGQELRRTGLVASRALAFAPDGRYALIAQGNDVELWDTTNGETVQRFIGHTGGIVTVAFSPDGQLVLTASDDFTTRLWDRATGRELHRFTGMTFVLSAAFSSDGRSVVTSNYDGTIRLWDARLPFWGHTAGINRAVFSPDQKYVLTGSSDATARLWEAVTGQLVREFTGHTASVNSVAFSPDGRYALTGSEDTTVRLWDVTTGQQVRQFSGHTATVWRVAFSPDGKYVASTDSEGRVMVWETATSQEVHRWDIGVNVSGLAFSPDGQFILTSSDDAVARLWDIASGKFVRNYSTLPIVATHVAFSPDGKYFVATGWGNEMETYMFDVETASPVRRFDGHIQENSSVAFSPDGQYVLVSSGDSTVLIWDAATGQLVRTIREPTGVQSAVYSPDGKLILTGSADGLARIWDADYLDSMARACSRLLRDFTDEERTQYGLANDGPTCPQP